MSLGERQIFCCKTGL